MKYLLILLLLSGCSTLSSFFLPGSLEKDAKIEWKKDLLMSINGVVYTGLALVPKADIYHLKIYPAEKTIDRLQWSSCHGGDHVDKAVKYSRWSWKKQKDYFEMTS